MLQSLLEGELRLLLPRLIFEMTPLRSLRSGVLVDVDGSALVERGARDFLLNIRCFCKGPIVHDSSNSTYHCSNSTSGSVVNLIKHFTIIIYDSTVVLTTKLPIF